MTHENSGHVRFMQLHCAVGAFVAGRWTERSWRGLEDMAGQNKLQTRHEHVELGIEPRGGGGGLVFNCVGPKILDPLCRGGKSLIWEA